MIRFDYKLEDELWRDLFKKKMRMDMEMGMGLENVNAKCKNGNNQGYDMIY